MKNVDLHDSDIFRLAIELGLQVFFATGLVRDNNGMDIIEYNPHRDIRETILLCAEELANRD